MRFRREELRPHGDHDGIIGITLIKEYDGNIASGDHFGRRDTSINWYVFELYR